MEPKIKSREGLAFLMQEGISVLRSSFRLPWRNAGECVDVDVLMLAIPHVNTLTL